MYLKLSNNTNWSIVFESQEEAEIVMALLKKLILQEDERKEE